MLNLNALDRAIGYLDPKRAIERARARAVLAYYDAARPDKQRKGRTAPESGNMAVAKGGEILRDQARYLEQNHDLARGVLHDLVMKTVGPYGIVPEPQPMNRAGEIDEAFAKQLSDGFKRWAVRPEVTGQMDWPGLCRLLCRLWMRDGEGFAQMLLGRVQGLQHASDVPFSLELMEADLLPYENSQPPSIFQSVEIDKWGRPLGYHSLLIPPGDMVFGGNFVSIAPSSTQRIPAERMLHVAHRDRVRQLRGVSIFASTLTRFDDLKDYEESERIAAKVAASMAAFIIKGDPTGYESNDDEEREMKFVPGMVFDKLRPGESVDTVDTKRPNANLLTYRQGQLRAVASGTGTSASSISKSYDGTYSAQRQELVEGWPAYATCSAEFISAIARRVYETWVRVGIASGVINVPRSVIPETADDAIYIAPQIPWIDPEAEAIAAVTAENAGYDSGPAIIRRRGGNPNEVLAQEAAWLKRKETAGLPPLSVPGRSPTPQRDAAPAQPPATTTALGRRGPQ